MNTEKKERITWTREETRAFLNAYMVRKEEFTNARKKKHAMQNVLLDLESQGVLSQPASDETLTIKMKNLVRAYKESMDANKRTGAAPCIAPFADLMDEIFGKSPIISNTHSINLYGCPLIEAKDTQTEKEFEVLETEQEEIGEPNKKKKYTRATPREKIAELKMKTKKEIAEKRLKAFAIYKKEKLLKIEEGQILKQKRHEERVTLLKQLVQNLKK